MENSTLPLRIGVGVIVLNNKNQVSKDVKKNGDEPAENKINQEEKNSNNIENLSAE